MKLAQNRRGPAGLWPGVALTLVMLAANAQSNHQQLAAASLLQAIR